VKRGDAGAFVALFKFLGPFLSNEYEKGNEVDIPRFFRTSRPLSILLNYIFCRGFTRIGTDLFVDMELTVV